MPVHGVTSATAPDDPVLVECQANLCPPEPLPRRLGVGGLVLIIVAFNAPIAAMAGFAQLSVGFGNGLGAPVSFLVAAAILLVFTCGFIAMSRQIEHPGAFYCYIVAGLGKAPGLGGAFLASAAYILLCAGSYPYIGLVAVESAVRMTGSSILPWWAWSVLLLALVTITGLLRVDVSVKILGKLVCLETALVAVWEAAIIIRGGPEGYSPGSFTPAAFLHGSAGLGVLFAMVCMIGVESAACFASETRNPETSVGRATYIAIIFMGVFYSLGIWTYIITQGASHAVQSASTNPVGTFFASVQNYLGGFFVKLVSFTLVTSQVAALNSVQGSASRYLYALGRDGVLSRRFALVHRRLQSPYVAVSGVALFSLTILAAIVLLGISPVASYAALTGMGIYFLLPLLIATSCSVIMFFRSHSAIEESVWIRLVAPSLAAISFIVLFVLTSLNLKVFVGSDAMAVVSMLGVASVPFSGWLLARNYRRSRPRAYEAIGNQ